MFFGLPFSAVASESTIANFDVRELLGDGVGRVRHQEADGDDQVVALLRQGRQVRHVVGARARRQDPALDVELLLGAQQADVRQVVEARGR